MRFPKAEPNAIDGNLYPKDAWELNFASGNNGTPWPANDFWLHAGKEKNKQSIPATAISRKAIPRTFMFLIPFHKRGTTEKKLSSVTSFGVGAQRGPTFRWAICQPPTALSLLIHPCLRENVHGGPAGFCETLKKGRASNFQTYVRKPAFRMQSTHRMRIRQ
jgi:hypothetical protein